MSRRALPGPLGRLLRQPLRAVAIALLAATAAAAAGVQSGAAAALHATMDDNWRGVYDILVTPVDGFDPVDGKLPPNTLASTGSGMSLDDLAAVRGVAGVEVAAPIGEILAPRLNFGQARIVIPRGFVGADDDPQAYRLTLTYTTDDGLGERLVARDEYPFVIDESTDEQPIDEPPCAVESYEFENYTVDTDKYSALGEMACMSSQLGDGVTMYMGDSSGASRMGNHDGAHEPEPVLNIPLPSAPQTVTRITLVDPEAEQALLGADAAFLDPLIAAGATATTNVHDMTAWADVADDPFGERFRDQITRNEAMVSGGYTDEQLAELRALFAENGDDWDAHMQELYEGTFYAPLLVADSPPAKLSVRLDVEAFGPAEVTQTEWGDIEYDLPDPLEHGAPGATVGSTAADVSELLNPFAAGMPDIPWPGADVSVTDALADWVQLQLMSVGTLLPSELTPVGTSVTLDPSHYSEAIQENQAPGSEFASRDRPEAIGAEAAYAGVKSGWSQGMGTQAIVMTPVGEFSPDDVTVDEQAASYVPLGAYAPVSSTITGGAHAGTTMLPSMTGLGLVSPRTVAIASIESAAMWRDTTPISSIRVRVDGISGYTPEAQQRVIGVAQAIEDLGFEASIVAGSSPTDVDVAVEGYAFGTMDPAGEQSVGPLGTVTQRWSELGAAARVSLSVSTATLTILGIALAAAILLLGAVQVAGIPARREQAVAMREVGFTRARIARWFAAEEVPGLAVVTVVGAAAVALSGGSGTAALSAAAAVVATLVLSVVVVVAGSRVTGLRMARDVRSRRLGARTVHGFGARQVIVHPLSSITHVLAILIVGLAAAGLVAALIAGQVAAGESSLALLTLARQLWPQVLLGLTGVIGGILLARLTRRIDLARRSEQWSTLRATGWTNRQLSTAQLVEGATIAVPAILLAAAATWFGAEALGLEPRSYTEVALVAAAAAALISFSVRRKGLA